jgi:hypothetical protein
MQSLKILFCNTHISSRVTLRESLQLYARLESETHAKSNRISNKSACFFQEKTNGPSASIGFWDNQKYVLHTKWREYIYIYKNQNE